jgi:hypothetical protein
VNIAELDSNKIAKMSRDEFRAVMHQVLTLQQTDRKENAISHYTPVSDEARKVHLSKARTVGIGGGNRASKTTSMFAEFVYCSTGRMPASLIPPDKQPDPSFYVDPKEKLRGPINVRIVCESLTTTMHPVLLPKLQWWKWNGIDAPGGERGHWGLIPRDCLIKGDWNRSWSEKLRTLRLLYRDPFDNDRVVGESMWQFMSFDQDASDFASGEFHLIGHDEPPTHAIWRENEARVMSVDGRMFLAMTWPDDPAIAVDWLFDKVYEPAHGANKDPNIDWVNIYATDNPHLNQEAIAIKAAGWTDEERQVRIYGQPIRFSNRVHPLFTDQDQEWCFPCGKAVVSVDGKCSKCRSSTLTQFNHVGDYPPNPSWPTLWLLDPHPRKPHMFAWWQINPQDDLFQVAEGECDGDPVDVAEMCQKIEGQHGMRVTHRFIDPNMGRSVSGVRREITWQDEFQEAGLWCDLASDSDVGRKRIDQYLRPDPRTLLPRIHIDRSCQKTIQQIKRYVWDDYRKSLEKAQKQTPKDKNDDYPTLMKYLLNTEPSFRYFYEGAPRIRRAPPARHARAQAARTR